MDHSLSSLLCQENQGELVGVDEDLYVQFEDSGVSEDEYVQVLIEKEFGFGFGRDESLLLMSDWIKTARLYAINWILKTRTTFGFRFQTAYLSVTYFDRFLSRRSIDSEKCWAFRLLSFACLSLAAKMEECDVPTLPEFPSQDYNFESKMIQRMELLVLSTLEWNMNFINPFAFLPYFVSKFCNQSQPPAHIWSNIMQLIFILMAEVNLMDRRPSVIAAAATLVAIDPYLTRNAFELRMLSVSQYWSLETENIFACYDLIQRLYKERTERDKVIHSSSPPPRPAMAINQLETSVVSSSAVTSSKRRRLTFTDEHKEEGRGKKHDES